jgi:hypothetical protein
MIAALRFLIGALLAAPKPKCFGSYRILSNEGRAINDCATCRHLRDCYNHSLK